VYQAAVDPLAGSSDQEQADEVTAALHVLAANPAFRGVSPEHLLDISRRGRKRRFLAGTVIMEQGAESDHVHFLLKGSVKIERGVRGQEPRMVAELGPGEIVGEMGILHGSPRTATVTALDDLETLELTAEEIRDVFRHDHDVVVAFIRMIHDRLHGTES
jgi:CRP/FNR family transcriptional regulator, cyclic AMP receptor protein